MSRECGAVPVVMSITGPRDHRDYKLCRIPILIHKKGGGKGTKEEETHVAITGLCDTGGLVELGDVAENGLIDRAMVCVRRANHEGGGGGGVDVRLAECEYNHFLDNAKQKPKSWQKASS